MLTDAAARKAKPQDKPYKLYDSGGLFLVVTTGGSKLWRMKYVRTGKEKLLSFGPYPEVTVSAARDARDAARAMLRAGQDPAVVNQALRKAVPDASRTFEAIARAWHEQTKSHWTEKHAADVLGSLEQSIFPELGSMDVREITPPMVLNCLRAIEARPAIETARRVRQRMSAVFVFAIGSGLAEQDPAAIVQGALAPLKKGRQPALVTLDEVRKVLADAEAIAAHPVTKLGLRFIALTAARPSEIRGAMWGELVGLDGLEPAWDIPAERMKMKRPHLVPLSRQAVEVIETVKLLTSKMPFIFPNNRNARKPMSENALGYLLNRAGYHHRHVPHGWRAAFSTIMNEQFRPDRELIDLMLAHAPKDEVEGAYNRALYLPRRRELAQIWADMLMEGLPPAQDLLAGKRK